MKIVVITQQTAFVRHWGKWYTVQRAGEDWRPLEIGKKYVKPKSITQISKELNKKYPSGAPMPSILDEEAADREVARIKAKHAKKPKRQVS